MMDIVLKALCAVLFLLGCWHALFGEDAFTEKCRELRELQGKEKGE